MRVLSELYNSIVKGVEQQATIAQGDSVVWLYVLDTVVAKAPVAEWHTVHGDKIVRIRAYFDARPFATPAS